MYNCVLKLKSFLLALIKLWSHLLRAMNPFILGAEGRSFSPWQDLFVP